MNDLGMYVICHDTTDYPGVYMVRYWTVGKHMVPHGVLGTAQSLDDARALIPDGLCCMYRSPIDDPVIVETWF